MYHSISILILLDDPPGFLRTSHGSPAVRNAEAGGPFSVPSPALERWLKQHLLGRSVADLWDIAWYIMVIYDNGGVMVA